MTILYRLLYIPFLLFFIFPHQAHAYGFMIGDESSLACNVYFEIINFSIALVILGMIVLLLNKLADRLKVSWMFFFLASVMFAALNLIGLLKAFDIADLSFAACIIELLMLVSLLLSVVSFRKIVRQIISNKSFTQDFKGDD